MRTSLYLFQVLLVISLVYKTENIIGQDIQTNFIEVIQLDDLELSDLEIEKFNKIKSNKTNLSAIPIKVDKLLKHLSKGRLKIKLPDNMGHVKVNAKIVKSFNTEDFVWYGMSTNGDEVMIVERNSSVVGSIKSGGHFYKIHDFGNKKNLLIKYDDQLLKNSLCETAFDTEENTGPKLTERKPSVKTRSSCDNPVVRIFMMYTPRAALVISPLSEANLLISQVNTMMYNSGISFNDLRFELAGVQQITNFSDERNESTLDLLHELQESDSINGYRVDNEADILGLFMDKNASIIGRSWLGEIPDGGDSDYGHFVIEADKAAANYSFSHEIAHLFRCRHENVDTNSTGSGGTTFVPFARGMDFTSQGNDYITIMSQLKSGYDRVPYYTDPNLTYNGVTIGESYRDNVRQIETIAEDIADYLPYTQPINAGISGTTTGNNNTMGSWTASYNSCVSPTYYKWEKSTNGLVYTTASQGSSATTYNQQFPQDNDLYLRLTITISGGDSEIGFLHVVNEDNQECGTPGTPPCASPIEPLCPIGNEIDKRIILFPNPTFSNEMTLTSNSKFEINSILIYSVNGNIIKSLPKITIEPYESIKVNIGDIEAGSYFVFINTNQKNFIEKIILLK